MNTQILLILSFLVIFFIFLLSFWGSYLKKNGYLVECFSNLGPTIDLGTPETSHTVNLPINTKFSCSNFCGPLSKCSITGEQCTSDVDCKGCQPIPNKEYMTSNTSYELPGDNDAGKYFSPTLSSYSKLTTDIGTSARIYNYDYLSPPPQYFQGVDTWTEDYKSGQQLFEQRNNPVLSKEDREYAPNYPKRYTLSGEFVDIGPLASNAYL
jgi:hypothetical protein